MLEIACTQGLGLRGEDRGINLCTRDAVCRGRHKRKDSPVSRAQSLVKAGLQPDKLGGNESVPACGDGRGNVGSAQCLQDRLKYSASTAEDGRVPPLRFIAGSYFTGNGPRFV